MGVDADDLAFRVEERSNGAFTFVPLPWRVILLTGVGILCWASNLHFLHIMGIDTASVLNMPPHADLQYPRPLYPVSRHLHSTTPTGSSRLYHAIYKLFAIYATWSIGCWLLFRALCGGNAQVMDQYKIVPETCSIVILAALVCPFNVLRKRERDLFLQGLYRCLFSPMNQPVYFSDVILADIFTSFAKVIGDLWISVCMFAPWGSLRVLPVDEGWMRWLAPSLMSLPYVTRLRQCLGEFLSSARYSNRQALLNAIKYSTAFPVIYLSAAQRLVVSELVAQKGSQVLETPWHGEHQLFRFWLLAVAVNSAYSFWWDVTNDWGLSVFHPPSISRPSSPSPQLHLAHLPKSPSSTSALHVSTDEGESSVGISDDACQPQTPWSARPYHPRGLRPVLLFNDTVVYYIAISLNLVLRLTWSLKLSSHLHATADLEGIVFLLEALELLRRWVWVFFRVEWEIVRNSAGVEAPPSMTEETVDG